MKFVHFNEDKPHRCPQCHKIPEEAYKDGYAIKGKIYQCKYCQVQWRCFDMRCMIQWLGPDGRTTPDTNEAVCLAQAFDPRVPDDVRGGFKVVTPFVMGEFILRYHRKPGSVNLSDGSSALPICEEHLKRLPPFWRVLPFPNQPESEWHARVKSQPPVAVLEAVINNFPHDCEAILKELRYHPGDKYWSFNRWGTHVGIESDGYTHS